MKKKSRRWTDSSFEPPCVDDKVIYAIRKGNKLIIASSQPFCVKKRILQVIFKASIFFPLMKWSNKVLRKGKVNKNGRTARRLMRKDKNSRDKMSPLPLIVIVIYLSILKTNW